MLSFWPTRHAHGHIRSRFLMATRHGPLLATPLSRQLAKENRVLALLWLAQLNWLLSVSEGVAESGYILRQALSLRLWGVRFSHESCEFSSFYYLVCFRCTTEKNVGRLSPATYCFKVLPPYLSLIGARRVEGLAYNTYKFQDIISSRLIPYRQTEDLFCSLQL